MDSLIKPQLIDRLVSLRSTLISQVIELAKVQQSIKSTCDSIDDAIPSAPDAHIDTMSHVIVSLKAVLGEYVKYFPKTVTLNSLSPGDVEAATTKLVDAQLWSMLFNRLNINSLLSKKSREAFRCELDSNPQAFTTHNVEATLTSLLADRHDIVLNSLLEVVTTTSTSYARNSRREVVANMVFENAISKNNTGRFCLDKHGTFYEAINLLSIVMTGKERVSSDNGMIAHGALWDEIARAFEGEHDDARDIVVYWGEDITIRFFNKGNAHLKLSKPLVRYLNEQLSKSKAIAA